MTKEDLQKIIASITEISNKRNYWFVRTQGGAYYESFVENSYIAIGYDRINISTIKNAFQNPHNKKALIEKIKERFPDEKRPGYIGKQLIDFTFNIKKGDIVLIPSYSSSSISIGEVTETPVFELKDRIASNDCPFLKRKKINWIKKGINFESIDPNLIRLKYSQRTVTKISDDLTPFIDRTILPMYIKEDNAHLALNVQKKSHLPAYSVFKTWSELLELTEEFGKEEQLDINKEDFDVRINVQSPGTIEFITYSVIGIVILSIMVVALIGAEYESKSSPFRFKFKSDGLIKKVTDFLNNKQDRIMKDDLNTKLKDMELNPDEVVKILEQINRSKNE